MTAGQGQEQELQAGSFPGEGGLTHSLLATAALLVKATVEVTPWRAQRVFSTCQEPINMMCERVNLTYSTSCCFYQQRIIDFQSCQCRHNQSRACQGLHTQLLLTFNDSPRPGVLLAPLKRQCSSYLPGESLPEKPKGKRTGRKGKEGSKAKQMSMLRL